MEEKTQNITHLIVFIFLGCYFARMFHMPNELIVLLGGAICLALIIQQKKIRIDLGVCLLACTLVSYYVISNGFKGIFYSILYIPLVIYIIVKYMICEIKDSEESDKKLFALVMVMVLGFTIHGILNSYMYFAGYVIPGTRQWQDFWSGEIVPGTQHAAYFLPMLAMFFPAVMYFKKRKVLNSIFIILTVFFCYTSLATRSRTPVMAFGIVVVIQVLLYLILEKEKTKKILSSKITWYAFTSMIVLLIVGFLLVKDTKVVSAFIENLSDDGGILGNARFVGQRLALQQLFEYPMGGRLMDFGELENYCHNTWLDMANAAGLIPFLAFTLYTLFSLWKLVLYMKNKMISTEKKLVMAGIYVVFFLFFTVEPAFDASIHYLTPWIFINGIIYEELVYCKG